jgi:hypothetical protein
MQDDAISCKGEVSGRSSTVIEHATLGAERRVRQVSWSHIGRIRSCERSAAARCGYQAHVGWKEFAQESRRQHPGLGPDGLQGGSAAARRLISGPSRVCRSHAEWIGRLDATRPYVDDEQDEGTRLKIVVARVQVPVSPPSKRSANWRLPPRDRRRAGSPPAARSRLSLSGNASRAPRGHGCCA